MFASFNFLLEAGREGMIVLQNQMAGQLPSHLMLSRQHSWISPLGLYTVVDAGGPGGNSQQHQRGPARQRCSPHTGIGNTLVAATILAGCEYLADCPVGSQRVSLAARNPKQTHGAGKRQ